MKIWLWFFSLVVGGAFAHANITPLGKVPDWKSLDCFQNTITSKQFRNALAEVYCPREEWWSAWMVVDEKSARIRKENGSDEWYQLNFKSADDSNRSDEFEELEKSLDGLVIALDPGHIGGKWSKMEKRHFQMGDDPPVKEGDLSLAVAKRLIPELEELGAVPYLVRDGAEPVTHRRPSDFRTLAHQWAGKIQSSAGLPDRLTLERERAELLFYRVDEIHARANLINDTLKPDLVICLHLNAAPWPDPDNRTLVDRNDFHVLVNGCYMGGELAYDDQRFELLLRLLNRWHVPERLLGESMASALAEITRLPAFSYKGPNALKVGDVPGVWARNLLANRIYHCPVIFLEPYVANSHSAYELIQKESSGQEIVEEYSSAVLAGLKNHFR
jgi:N-acetylmuramoyl-L-alanine amidase